MGGEHPMSQTMAPTVDVSGNLQSSRECDRDHHLQSSQELDRDHPARSSGNKDRDGLRASQSFDESVKIGFITTLIQVKSLLN